MDIPGLPARKAALRLIDAVLRRGETIEQAAQPALQGVRGDADRALARAIAGEVLRWLTDLDGLIDSATQQRLPDDAKARAVLQLMLAQWIRLETPPHAVIATALPLLTGGPRRLAHGVFSALVKREVKLPDAPTLPPAVAERWGERGEGIAKALAVPPPLDLTLRDPGDTARWAEELGGISLMSGHVRLPRGEAIERLAGFKDGAWWVQDLAASLPAHLLGLGEGRTVLDMCTAPGGKALQLAASGWQVVALDSSAKRLALVHQNLARTGLTAEVVNADALQWQPEAQFDAVLLDAPCTATGTCRRHPDVLHRIGIRHIAEMVEIQAALLERAANWVKSGGRLVYAVCSLEPEEGEGQAAQVSLTHDPIRADELPTGLAPTPEGWLKIDPGMLPEASGLDGFFVARWRK